VPISLTIAVVRNGDADAGLAGGAGCTLGGGVSGVRRVRWKDQACQSTYRVPISLTIIVVSSYVRAVSVVTRLARAGANTCAGCAG
jgi:meiotically up-regulated gene 157 (Mug157) protein